MAMPQTRWTRSFGQLSIVGMLFAISLAGCAPNHPNGDATEKTTAGASAGDTGTDEKPIPADPRLQKSFAEATRPEPPADGQRPPDLTLTGKSVGKLYREIVRLWDMVHFTTKGGKSISYTAVLDTELGSVEIALRPD